MEKMMHDNILQRVKSVTSAVRSESVDENENEDDNDTPSQLSARSYGSFDSEAIEALLDLLEGPGKDSVDKREKWDLLLPKSSAASEAPGDESDLNEVEIDAVDWTIGRDKRMSSSALKLIHVAAIRGYDVLVRWLLDRGANINAKCGWIVLDDCRHETTATTSAFTALHWAAAYDRAEVVKVLLSSESVDIDGTNGDGNTALMEAAKLGHDKVVELLTVKEAKVDCQNKNGETALIMAARGKSIDVMRKLLARKADVTTRNKNGYSALLAASQFTDRKHRIMAKKLKKHGAAFSAIDLHIAVNIDDQRLMRKVAQKGGVDITARNETNETILHSAVRNNKPKCATALLSGDVEAMRLMRCRNDHGRTPLHVAAYSRAANFVRDMITLLRRCGTVDDANAIDEDGCTALHLAVSVNSPEVVRELVILRPDVLDSSGLSALHLSVLPSTSQNSSSGTTGTCDTLKALLETFSECDVDLVTGSRSKTTALMLAVESGNVDGVKLLLKHHSSLSAAGRGGLTAVHMLARLENDDLVEQTYQVIIDHAPTWWRLTHNTSKSEKIGKDAKVADSLLNGKRENDNDEIRREAILAIACQLRYDGMNLLQYASYRGAAKLLQCISSTEAAFMITTRYRVSTDVTYIVPSTLPPAERRHQPSCLELVVGLESEESTTQILNQEPFTRSTKLYRRLIDLAGVVILMMHLCHMVCFTYYAMPRDLGNGENEDNSTVDLDVEETTAVDSVANSRPASEPDIHESYFLFTLWPALNLFLEFFNVILTCRFRIWMKNTLSTMAQSSTRRESTMKRHSGGGSSGRGSTSTLTSWPKVIFHALSASLIVSATFLALTVWWYIEYVVSGNNRELCLISVALTFVVGWTYTTTLFTMFETQTQLVRVIKRIIIKDLVRFLLLYVFIVVGFSLAFQGVSQHIAALTDDATTSVSNTNDERETKFVYLIYVVFCQMVGMESVVETINLDDNTNITLTIWSFARVLLVVYIFLSTVILLNLLIAMMNDTYNEAVQQVTAAMNVEKLQLLRNTLAAERLLSGPIRFLLAILNWFDGRNRIVNRHRFPNRFSMGLGLRTDCEGGAGSALTNQSTIKRRRNLDSTLRGMYQRMDADSNSDHEEMVVGANNE